MTAAMVISVWLTRNDDLACAGFRVLPGLSPKKKTLQFPLTYFSGACLNIYFPLMMLMPDVDEVYLNSQLSLSACDLFASNSVVFGGIRESERDL